MSRDKSTVTFEDFSGGIDLREGLISRDGRACYDMLNYQITPGKKLKRRVSCEKLNGSLPVDDCFMLDGQLTAFLPEFGGSPFTVVGLTVPTRVFRYDTPPFCEALGKIIDAGTLSGTPVALIEHSLVYDTTKKVLYLHVFDDPDEKIHFSYVSDGGPPCYWTPRLPQHPYGKDKPGSAKQYAARMDIEGGRIAITLPDGDTAYSAVNRPRVFNERTAQQMLDEGRWWYIMGSPEGDCSVRIDTPSEDGYLDAVESYGIEILTDTGEWERLDSVAVPERIRFLYTRLTYTLTADQAGRPIRFYAFSKPEAVILAGCQLLGNGSISAGTIKYRGVSVPVPSIESPFLGGIHGQVSFYYYGFHPETFEYVRTAIRPQGKTVICAYCDFTDASTAFGPGTVSLSGVTVTGTGGTLFTSFFPAQPEGGFGYIYFEGVGIRKIVTRPSDTSLTVDSQPRNAVGAFRYAKPSVPQIILPGTYSTEEGYDNIESKGTVNLKSNQLLTSRVTIGSEVKRIIGAAPNAANGVIGMTMDSVYTTTNASAIAVYVPVYVYDYQMGDTGTEQYANREAEALVLAGDGDAGFFTSSQYAQEGDLPVAISVTQNRVFLQYSHAIQMWALGPALDPSFLSKQEIGAGGNDYPEPQAIDDGVMFPTTFGPRMFLPSGNAKDYITYIPFGDKLTGIDLPMFKTSAWWQEQGIFLTASTLEGEAVIWTMSYNKQNRIAAWGRWTIEGLTKIDRLLVGQGTLLILTDGTVYQFRPDSTVFADDIGSSVLSAYVSSRRGLYSDMDKPRNNKRVSRLDLAQKGTAQFSLYANPGDLADRVMPTDAPVITGYTMGTTKVPLAAMSPALAYEISSTDETGHELYSVSFDYVLLKR